jgi:hypothetical protein
MERFGWTQQQVDEAPEDTIQAILLRWRVEAEAQNHGDDR